MCLNPCCSGRWSRTDMTGIMNPLNFVCLNPCCSGRWSRTDKAVSDGKKVVMS